MDVRYNNIYGYIFETKARVIINYGGRDSGKSFFVGGQYIPIMMLKEKYFRGMAVKKTYTSCKDSVYKEITDGIEFFNQDHNFNCVKNPLEIRCKNKNFMIFRGLDNPKNLKSIKGLNFIWVEEAEDLAETEFDDLTMLLRGGENQKIILTFNPVDQEHFTNRRFVECKKDRILETFDDGEPKVWEIDVKEEIDGHSVEYTVLVICSTYNDNEFIAPVRKLTIEKLKDTNPFLYEVYRKGKFGSRGGRILNNVEMIDFNERGIHFNNFDRKGYSQDFGFNHANCILWAAERENCLYIFDEIYVNEMNTPEIIKLAERKGVEKRYNMICDSEDPNAIDQWKKAGYRSSGVKKYPGSVNAQIDKLQSYDKIYLDIKCVNTYKESKSWQWKQNKNGVYIDEPVTVFDDAMAALRYTCDLFDVKSKGVSFINWK